MKNMPQDCWYYVLFAFFAALLLINYLEKKYFQKRVLALHRLERPTSDGIKSALRKINENSKGLVFCMEQHANFELEGQRICVIWGHISGVAINWKGGSSLSSSRNLYVLVPSSQKSWFERKSKLFRVAAINNEYALYWILNLKSLLRLVQQSERGAAGTRLHNSN